MLFVVNASNAEIHNIGVISQMLSNTGEKPGWWGEYRESDLIRGGRPESDHAEGGALRI